MEKEKIDIELRSDKFQEIVKLWPSWMKRSGIAHKVVYLLKLMSDE